MTQLETQFIDLLASRSHYDSSEARAVRELILEAEPANDVAAGISSERLRLIETFPDGRACYLTHLVLQRGGSKYIWADGADWERCLRSLGINAEDVISPPTVPELMLKYDEASEPLALVPGLDVDEDHLGRETRVDLLCLERDRAAIEAMVRARKRAEQRDRECASGVFTEDVRGYIAYWLRYGNDVPGMLENLRQARRWDLVCVTELCSGSIYLLVISSEYLVWASVSGEGVLNVEESVHLGDISGITVESEDVAGFNTVVGTSGSWNHVPDSSPSVVGSALVGGVLAGPTGAVVGAAHAVNKGNKANARALEELAASMRTPVEHHSSYRYTKTHVHISLDGPWFPIAIPFAPDVAVEEVNRRLGIADLSGYFAGLANALDGWRSLRADQLAWLETHEDLEGFTRDADEVVRARLQRQERESKRPPLPRTSSGKRQSVKVGPDEAEAEVTRYLKGWTLPVSPDAIAIAIQGIVNPHQTHSLAQLACDDVLWLRVRHLKRCVRGWAADELESRWPGARVFLTCSGCGKTAWMNDYGTCGQHQRVSVTAAYLDKEQ